MSSWSSRPERRELSASRAPASRRLATPVSGDEAEPKPSELLTPTPIPDSARPPLLLQHQINLGDAASRLAEANPERLMNALETSDARSFDLAKMRVEIAGRAASSARSRP